MVSSEEVGCIISRIAIADEGFLTLLLVAAHKAGGARFPEDCAKLSEWGKYVQLLRASSETDKDAMQH